MNTSGFEFLSKQQSVSIHLPCVPFESESIKPKLIKKCIKYLTTLVVDDIELKVNND